MGPLFFIPRRCRTSFYNPSFEKEENLIAREELRIYSPTSAGTAIGGSHQEAIFFAISEYLERHNGLRAWYEKKRLVKWNERLFKSDPILSSFFSFFAKENCQISIINTTRQCEYFPSRRCQSGALSY
ncbi:YcaO-like family protein [Paenibacillus popilliae]|uniref:YcaO-like family protein n=1 Tax=Paenibacillus popilliae TaxID=78057 RepID=UPI000B830AC4